VVADLGVDADPLTARARRRVERELESRPGRRSSRPAPARLATELMNTPDWKRAHLLAEEAMSSALASDSRAVLPRCACVISSDGRPHTLETRRDYMNDVLELTANDRDPIQRFFALSMAASAAIEAADVAQADAHLDTAFRIARETDVPVLAYNAECIRVWRTGMAGDLAEAERLAFAAMKLGTRNGIDFAVVGPDCK